MGFNKNAWIKKHGYEKVGGKIFLPVHGKEILEESTLNRILLDKACKEKIEIHGDLAVSIEDDLIQQNDLTLETEEFIGNIMKGSCIQKAWVDKQGSLTIEIASNPAISIYVDCEKFDWPIEKWTYDQKSGYLTN